MDREKIIDYLYENIASVFWSAFLLVGGAIFVSYYDYIGYMPDFDFKSAIIILSAASITAIITVIMFMIVLVMPGAFWVEIWTNQSSLKSNWEDSNGEKRLGAIAIWFSVPILIFYLGIVVAFYSKIFLVFYTCLVVGSFYLTAYNALGLRGIVLHLEIWKMLFFSFICAALAFFPLYLVAKLSLSEISTSKGPASWVGLIVAIFIVFVNIMATMKPKSAHGFMFYGGLGLVAFFIVFASFEIFHRIPERVMEIYKFGAIENASVVLKEDGCKTLKNYRLIEESWEGGQCFLGDAKILSRLGSDMYIEKNELRITVNNSEVLSWSTGQIFNKSVQPTAKASAD